MIQGNYTVLDMSVLGSFNKSLDSNTPINNGSSKSIHSKTHNYDASTLNDPSALSLRSHGKISQILPTVNIIVAIKTDDEDVLCKICGGMPCYYIQYGLSVVVRVEQSLVLT